MMIVYSENVIAQRRVYHVFVFTHRPIYDNWVEYAVAKNVFSDSLFHI